MCAYRAVVVYNILLPTTVILIYQEEGLNKKGGVILISTEQLLRSGRTR